MKPQENISPAGEEQHWEATEDAGKSADASTRGGHLEDISGTIEVSGAEVAQEALELRKQIEEIEPKIEQLSRKMEAVMKSPLTDSESAERNVYVQKMVLDAERNGSHPEITQRIGDVAREQFEKKTRERHIKDSPQGQELERLKNRQFDMKERLRQIESGE